MLDFFSKNRWIFHITSKKHLAFLSHFSPAFGSRTTLMTANLAIDAIWPVESRGRRNLTGDELEKSDEFLFPQKWKETVAGAACRFLICFNEASGDSGSGRVTHDASHLLKAAAYYGGQARPRLHQTSCSAAQIVLQALCPGGRHTAAAALY